MEIFARANYISSIAIYMSFGIAAYSVLHFTTSCFIREKVSALLKRSSHSTPLLRRSKRSDCIACLEIIPEATSDERATRSRSIIPTEMEIGQTESAYVGEIKVLGLFSIPGCAAPRGRRGGKRKRARSDLISIRADGAGANLALVTEKKAVRPHLSSKEGPIVVVVAVVAVVVLAVVLHSRNAD